MNYYVFEDNNNGHFSEYFNFTSDATKQQIYEVTDEMEKENPVYSRMGSKVNDLVNALLDRGYKGEIQENSPNNCAVDRILIPCISGNY